MRLRLKRPIHNSSCGLRGRSSVASEFEVKFLCDTVQRGVRLFFFFQGLAENIGRGRIAQFGGIRANTTVASYFVVFYTLPGGRSQGGIFDF